MLSKDVKGLAALWTKAKYGKMSIEGRDLVDAQTPHYSEAGAIHDGKILVAPGNTNTESCGAILGRPAEGDKRALLRSDESAAANGSVDE